MENSKDRVVIASDVSDRDGIGIEIYRNNELVMEIFRDDANKRRVVTLFKTQLALELIEEGIQIFKNEIPFDFID